MSRLIASLAYWPSLAFGVLVSRVLRVWNVWDEIDDGVLLGGLPWKRDAARLHEAGVRAVVNTCEEYAGPSEEYERLGIEQLYLPTVDFLPPSFEAINRAVDFIDRHREGDVDDAITTLLDGQIGPVHFKSSGLDIANHSTQVEVSEDRCMQVVCNLHKVSLDALIAWRIQ